MLKKNDQLKFEIIAKVVAGLITAKLAAKVLNVSFRTILRYKKNNLIKKAAPFSFMAIWDDDLIMPRILRLKKKL